MEIKQRISLMGMEIDHVTEGQVVATIGRSLSEGRGGWVITPNLEHLRRFRKERSLHEYFSQADLVLADGMPLVWASRIKGTPLPARVAGSDLIWSLSMEAAKRGRSVFVLGGTLEAGWEAAKKLQDRCPGLRIAGMIYPPHGFENDPTAMDQIVETLESARPDIVYVGLGFPKQEKVIATLRERFPQTWFLGIGISIGFVGGQVSRAPVWMQRAGLEWLHRLAQEPGRLGRRYLLHGLPFAARLLMHGAVSRIGRGRTGEAPAQLPYNRAATTGRGADDRGPRSSAVV
ncbi:MAG TPA: WecB/TagA/CpsF family glycosyltransferase [Candidatus Dormibacteraeota bacterium]|nr:WecB/TagA/CpsF family glycosyltransferase [Candidatus Dormibacteraeota bacterium]